MNKAKRSPFAMQAGLTLALSVSASFMHVAAAPAPIVLQIETRKDSDLRDMPVSEKAKLRDNIKRAMKGLQEMNQFLANCCAAIVGGEHIPPHAIEDEPFTKISESFRDLEIAMADKWMDFAEMPIISQEIVSLRRALATARSRATQNAMLLKQLQTIPEVVDSDVDMDGLDQLAHHSTQRLLKLVG